MKCEKIIAGNSPVDRHFDPNLAPRSIFFENFLLHEWTPLAKPTHFALGLHQKFCFVRFVTKKWGFLGGGDRGMTLLFLFFTSCLSQFIDGPIPHFSI